VNAHEPATYYEVLQVSRNADLETIHRVYRILAARFHPDNPKTGDVEKFLTLERAYRVLSDPARRADYDALCPGPAPCPVATAEPADFLEDGIEGEWNRRLGVLSLLYQRCRTKPDNAGISVLELERRMGLPDDLLGFTLWYLKAKGYISVGDNSDYCLTVQGADYFESKASAKSALKQLEKARLAAPASAAA
jgi:curved DNA-binding protein